MVLLFAGGRVRGQVLPPDDTSKVAKNTIAIGTYSLPFVYFVGGSFYSYKYILATYKRKVGSINLRFGHAFRYYRVTTSDKFIKDYTSWNNIGVEGYLFKSHPVSFIYGGDIVFRYKFSYNVKKRAYTEKRYYVGLSPLIGLSYDFCQHLTFTTEIGVAYGKGTQTLLDIENWKYEFPRFLSFTLGYNF